jgi:hypothetical protein
MLRRHGVADGFSVEDVPVPFDETDVARAEEVVAPRREDPQWGWKEPRSSLFLDLWDRALPDARFLFLVRPPLVVLDSLLRRAANESVRSSPVRGLVLWRLHNAEMLRFSRAHPDACLWCTTASVVQRPDRLLSMLRERFDLDLEDAPFGDVFDANELHEDVRGRVRIVAATNRAEAKRCRELYEEITSLATAMQPQQL